MAEGRPITATQMGIDLDTEGNISIIKTPNMRLVDMARQGLDAMIADERNDITGRLSARGVALSKVRQAYVGEIETLDRSGLYKKGREIWGGYSKSLDSVRLGRTIFQRPPPEIAEEFSKLSPSDKEFYRIGVADMVKERMAKTGLSGDEAKALIKNPWMRDQLKPIFKSSKDFEEFVDSVMQERLMFETKQMALGGSQTAARRGGGYWWYGKYGNGRLAWCGATGASDRITLLSHRTCRHNRIQNLSGYWFKT